MEYFVTFEIAKKLKDKGFQKKCLAYYDVEDNVGLLYNTQYTNEVLPCQYTDLLQCHNTGEAETLPDNSCFCVDAPTISQVLKWLREDKNIHIIVEISDSGWYYTLYPNVRWEDSKLKSDKYIMSFKNKNSYEEAALAGIEYVLDNLI